jgi:hypothetical protein
MDFSFHFRQLAGVISRAQHETNKKTIKRFLNDLKLFHRIKFLEKVWEKQSGNQAAIWCPNSVSHTALDSLKQRESTAAGAPNLLLNRKIADFVPNEWHTKIVKIRDNDLTDLAKFRRTISYEDFDVDIVDAYMHAVVTFTLHSNEHELSTTI